MAMQAGAVQGNAMPPRSSRRASRALGVPCALARMHYHVTFIAPGTAGVESGRTCVRGPHVPCRLRARQPLPVRVCVCLCVCASARTRACMYVCARSHVHVLVHMCSRPACAHACISHARAAWAGTSISCAAAYASCAARTTARLPTTNVEPAAGSASATFGASSAPSRRSCSYAHAEPRIESLHATSQHSATASAMRHCQGKAQSHGSHVLRGQSGRGVSLCVRACGCACACVCVWVCVCEPDIRACARSRSRASAPAPRPRAWSHPPTLRAPGTWPPPRPRRARHRSPSSPWRACR